MVNCKLSPKFPLVHSLLTDISAIDAYIFWSLLFLPLSHERLPFSLKRTWFFPFLILFRWLLTFRNQMIFRSTSETFPRCTFRTSVLRITSRTLFFLFLSDPLKNIFRRMIRSSSKIALCMDSFLFHYSSQILSYCLNLINQSVNIIWLNIFGQWIFLLFLALPDELLFEQNNFHLDKSYPKMCASVDIMSKYWLHRLIKIVHYGIF